MLGREDLADYLRLMCSNSLKTNRCQDSNGNEPNSSNTQAAITRPSSSATATEERPASSGRLQALGKWRLAVASASGMAKAAGQAGLAGSVAVFLHKDVCIWLSDCHQAAVVHSKGAMPNSALISTRSAPCKTSCTV